MKESLLNRLFNGLSPVIQDKIYHFFLKKWYIENLEEYKVPFEKPEPLLGEEIFIISFNGVIMKTLYKPEYKPVFLWGNCFSTEAEAMIKAKKIQEILLSNNDPYLQIKLAKGELTQLDLLVKEPLSKKIIQNCLNLLS
jgi:hypothetical protein